VLLLYIDYEQHRLKDIAKITTAENEREIRVMGRRLDGYTEIINPYGIVERSSFVGAFGIYVCGVILT